MTSTPSIASPLVRAGHGSHRTEVFHDLDLAHDDRVLHNEDAVTFLFFCADDVVDNASYDVALATFLGGLNACRDERLFVCVRGWTELALHVPERLEQLLTMLERLSLAGDCAGVAFWPGGEPLRA